MLQDKCDYAVVPFENSTNGSVVFTLDILRDIFHTGDNTSDSTGSIHVTDEIYVPINHCLISNATAYCDIKRLYTHPQAWGQVDIFTRSHFPADIEKIDANSTSAAVELAKTDPEGAAIAAAAAASVHNVPVLKANIANKSNNTTRFLVFSRLTSDSALTYKESSAAKAQRVTLVSFIIPHDSPGALANTLLELAKRNISLTSINSRPSGKMSWMYVFFIEFLGDASDESVTEALKSARSHCEELEVLGSFARSQAYFTSRETTA